MSRPDLNLLVTLDVLLAEGSVAGDEEAETVSDKSSNVFATVPAN